MDSNEKLKQYQEKKEAITKKTRSSWKELLINVFKYIKRFFSSLFPDPNKKPEEVEKEDNNPKQDSNNQTSESPEPKQVPRQNERVTEAAMLEYNNKLSEFKKLTSEDPRTNQIDKHIKLYEELKSIEEGLPDSAREVLETPVHDIILQDLYIQKELNDILEDLFKIEGFDTYNSLLGDQFKDISRGFITALKSEKDDVENILTLIKENPEEVAESFKVVLELLIKNGLTGAGFIYDKIVDFAADWMHNTEKSEGQNLPFDMGYFAGKVFVAAMTGGLKKLTKSAYLAANAVRLTPKGMLHLGDNKDILTSPKTHIKLNQILAKALPNKPAKEIKKLTAKIITKLQTVEPLEQAKYTNEVLKLINSGLEEVKVEDYEILKEVLESSSN